MTGRLSVDSTADGVVLTVSEGPAFYSMHFTQMEARELAGAINSAASGLCKVVFPAKGGE